jgi:diguanylate cyclase (GGDEF)-like protein
VAIVRAEPVSNPIRGLRARTFQPCFPGTRQVVLLGIRRCSHTGVLERHRPSRAEGVERLRDSLLVSHAAPVSRRQSLPPALVLSAAGNAVLPARVQGWLAALHGEVIGVTTTAELMAIAMRSRPRVAVLDARNAALDEILLACTRLKADSYTGIVPTLVLLPPGGDAREVLDAGADEVLAPGPDGCTTEDEARLRALLRRSDRDTGVHPSTRLPGAVEIEAEIARRIGSGERFAVCYADLDHFKEFNDRYGYNNGDRIIRLLARILHDVVKGECGEQGFVGHIGGDDFLFVVPLEGVQASCQEIINVFDTLVPLQYSEQDQRSGYFFGKDRRGRLHRVPLMTLSIGVVTNERRRFVKASQVSELATEMKSYAKSLQGSVFSVDRRSERQEGDEVGIAGEAKEVEVEGGIGRQAARSSGSTVAGEGIEEPEVWRSQVTSGRMGGLPTGGSGAGRVPASDGRSGARTPGKVARAIAQLGED